MMMVNDELLKQEEQDNRLEAELQLFGIALNNMQKAPAIFGELDPDLFVFDDVARAFVKARDHWKKNGSISPAALLIQLTQDEKDAFFKADSMYYPSLGSQTESLMKAYKDQVSALKAREVAERMSTVSSIDEVLNYISELQNITKGVQTTEPLTFAQAVAEFAYDMSEPVHYIETGYPSLDANLLIDRGDFIILAGEQSAGKTAFSISLALSFASQGYRVVYYSLETTKKQIFYRANSIYTGVKFEHQLRRELTEDDMTRFGNKQDELASLPITVIECSDWTVERIKADALRRNAEVVFIDYVGLIKDNNKTVYDKSTAISLALHSMAQSTGIAVVALSQKNRQSNKEQIADMHTLNGSGQLESDADLILMLTVKGDKEDKDTWAVEVRVSKNKKGRVTKEVMIFDGTTQRFREMTSEEKYRYKQDQKPTKKEKERPIF